MRIFITGATGLIGKRLVVDRLGRGDSVVVLSRSAAKAQRMFAADANPKVEAVEGDPTQAGEWQKSIEGCDAVVHLAGAGVADKRWTAAYKRELVRSRVDSTDQVVAAIAAAQTPPRVLINGSAIGFYGNTGDDAVDESAPSPPQGENFLADICVQTEARAWRAREHGHRVVLLRTGMVLDDRGGALLQMMRPFKFFVGGPIGRGGQYMSWIHYRDMLGLIDLALRDETLKGALNCVAPNPVRNREFARALGEAMERPSWLPTPPVAIRLAIGEFGKYIVQSQYVLPAKAEAHGYHFLFPQIEGALQSLLARPNSRANNRNNARNLERGFKSPAADEDPPAPAIATAPSEELIEHPREAAARHRPRRERPVAPIRLVAIDVDGTLLRTDGHLSRSVIDSCRAAKRQGCEIIPATARPPRAMRSLLHTLDLDGPMINYNGAVIWDAKSNRPLHHEALEPDLVRSIIDDARNAVPDLIVSVEILDKWYTDRLDTNLPTETSRMFDPDYIGSLDSFLNQPITKLMLLAEHAAIGPVEALVRERYVSPSKVAVFITDPHIIQIAHPLVDKGVALERIANERGIDRDQVMVIGDGPNDAGMVEWAGFSVAVGNACETVRLLADQIVASNDEHGVARAIQRYVLARE